MHDSVKFNTERWEREDKGQIRHVGLNFNLRIQWGFRFSTVIYITEK